MTRTGRGPIREFPRCEKPRERMIQRGPEALQDAELLAILLGSGMKGHNVLTLAKEILKRYPPRVLAQLSWNELLKLKGIGPARACLIQASIELSRRALCIDQEIAPEIRTPRDAVDLVSHLRSLKKEHFIVLCLNARNQVIAQETVSIGSVNASLVHPREVFQPAVARSAASVVLAHNHPSGDCTPSDDDFRLTKRLVRAGEILGIPVLDHVIISRKGFRSIRADGFI